MEKYYSKVSLFSVFVDKMIKLLPYKKSSINESNAKKYIYKKKDNKFKNRNNLNYEFSINNKMGIYSYNGKIDSCDNNGFLIYIHGGSFIERANWFQINFAKYIAKKSNYTLIFCDYPLAPKSDCVEMFDLFYELYKIIVSKNKCINLLGDSAGGGFAIAFAKYVYDKNMQVPCNIIALSPWLDISMKDDSIYEMAKSDNMCGVDGTKYMGKLWARNISTDSPMISPYYSNVSNIGTISIITGGYDILRNQCFEFHKRLIKEGINHNYIFYKNQGHIFGVFPTKEGIMVRKDIVNILKGDIKNERI